MKIFFVIFLSLLLVTNYALCDDITAVADGDWIESETWGGDLPESGDNVIIPAGITVEVTSNENIDGDPMYIEINGTLEFIGGGSKLRLPCISIVQINIGGSIVPSGSGAGSSKQLIICAEVVWEARDGIFSGALTLKESTLPVELTSFEGAIENGSVQLKWTTASEINNDFFQIERSTDGITFETVTIINGNGTTNEEQSYAAFDDIPVVGTSYYRLKQVDFDGKYEYSTIISINFANELLSNCKFNIFPNPCLGKCHVDLKDCPDSDNEDITFYVYDAFGNAVLASSPKTITQGQARFSFDSNNKIKPGMYIVRGKAKDKMIEDKMIVNK